jgi:hypothetical protein
MTYKLVKLAPGAYDVLLAEDIVAGLGRGASSGRWILELLESLPPERRLAPFTQLEHRYGTPGEACSWLGAEVEGVGVRLGN